MSQGLIGGVLWGALAAGFGLVVISQVAPAPGPLGQDPAEATLAVATAEPATSAKTGAVATTAAAPVAPPSEAPARIAAAEPATPAPAPAETAATELPVAADRATLEPAPAVAATEAPANATSPAPASDVASAVEPTLPEQPELPVPAADPESALPVETSKVADPAPAPGTPGQDVGEAPESAAKFVAVAPEADAGAGAEPVAVAEADTPPADLAPVPEAAPTEAAKPAAPAPGAKFVSVAPKQPPADAPAMAAEAPSALPPTVVATAPEAVASQPQPNVSPVLPGASVPPGAVARPAAVAAAGAPPAAPPRPTQVAAATVVVTEAPAAMAPAPAGQGAAPDMAVTARGGFQPDRIVPSAPPVADAPPAAGTLPPPPPLTAEERAILAEAGGEDAALPEVVVLAEAADPPPPKVLKKPAPLPPAPSLAAKGQIATTESLPRVGTAAPGTSAPPPPVAEAAAVPEVTLPDDAPPIDRFARPFDNAAGKPLFAVVLVDTGDPQLDRAALAAMPFPVTFALDPSAPAAALAASIYRAAGQEVVMLATGLPEGATAADVEVSFGAHDAALPEAVAVLDPEVGGFQGNRPLSTLVVPVLKGQGRGLLSWDRGLNAASQVARRDGLRSGVIFRRLDGEGEPKAQIRRYLDRAAFKAAQDGRVIVAGETRPDTVAALLEWAVEGRAATVALAPLSAALKVE